MFRQMRRIRQQMCDTQSATVLNKAKSGVLSVCGDNGYPYGIPLSFVYCNNKIFFHSAKTGHKIDAINKNPKVCFCVVWQDNIVPEKFTTEFMSVTVFGKAHIVSDYGEKLNAIKKLAEKYSPDFMQESVKEIEASFDRFAIIELDIEHITGKQAIELAKSDAQKKNNL